MLLNLIKKTTVVLLLLCTIQTNAVAQSAQQIMSRIYKSYDSIPFLTFDVKYIYSSDTVNGDFIHDVLLGSYTMAGKKAKYNLGNIDFVQNDSFFLSIYNTEKFIIVADPINNNTGNALPIRGVIDSLIKTYATSYKITTSQTEETGIINFAKANELAQFENFSIVYNVDQNFLQNVQYKFKEPVTIESEDGQQTTQIRQKILTLEFYNYRYDNFSDEVYDENKYIFFEEGVCKPVNEYKDYRIFYSRATPIK